MSFDFVTALKRVRETLGGDTNEFLRIASRAMKDIVDGRIRIVDEAEETPFVLYDSVPAPYIFQLFDASNVTMISLNNTSGEDHTIDKSVFVGMPDTITTVDFNGYIVTPGVLALMPQLKTLWISDGGIFTEQLSPNLLSGLPNLKSLILQYRVNEITLSQGFFSNNTRLRRLHLTGTIELEANLLEGISLKELHVRDNDWITWQRLMDTKGLSSVEHLMISSNEQLQILNDGYLTGLTELEHLETDITKISQGAFVDTPKLSVFTFHKKALKISNILGVVYVNLDTIDDVTILDNDSPLEYQINQIRRGIRNLMKKGLPLKKATKATLALLDKEATGWQQICSKLSKDYKIAELRAIAQSIGLTTADKTKRQLCAELAQDYEKLNSGGGGEGSVDRQCHNSMSSDMVTPYNEMSDDEVVEYTDERGKKWCFSLEELEQFQGTRRNPYNRDPIPDKVFDQLNRTRSPDSKTRERQNIHTMARVNRVVSAKPNYKRLFTQRITDTAHPAPPNQAIEDMSDEKARHMVRHILELSGHSSAYQSIVTTMSIDKYKGLLAFLDRLNNDELAVTYMATFVFDEADEAEEEDEDEEEDDEDEEEDDALISASSSNNPLRVRTLLERGANPAYENDRALILAVENGHVDVVTELLRHNVYSNSDIHTRNKLSLVLKRVYDARPYNVNVIAGHIYNTIWDALVTATYTSIEEEQRARSGWRLIRQVINRNLLVVQTLLGLGVNPDYMGHKALYIAAMDGSSDIVRELLQNRIYQPAEFSESVDAGLRSILHDVMNNQVTTNYLEISRLIRDTITLAGGEEEDDEEDDETGNEEEEDEDDEEESHQRNERLRQAGINGRIDVVRDMLSSEMYSPEEILRRGYTGRLLDIAGQVVDAGYTEIAQLILERLDERAVDEDNLIRAAASGNAQEVRSSLSRGVNPTAANHRALLMAGENGHIDAVRELLSDDWYDRRIINGQGYADRLLEIADNVVDAGSDDATEIARLIRERVHVNDRLVFAAARGHRSQVRTLLGEGADQSYENHKALLVAAERGHDGVVRELFLSNAYSRDEIRTRGYTGRLLEIVDDIVLRRTPDYNPIAHLIRANVAPLVNAILDGNSDEVNRLIQAGEVPTNDMLVLACKRLWDVNIPQSLLNSEAIDPRYNNSECLFAAVQFDRRDIVRLLLGDRRADPNDGDSRALREAIERGYIQIVRLLLDDNRTLFRGNDEFALRLAAEHDNEEIVELLLSKYHQAGRGVRYHLPEFRTYVSWISDTDIRRMIRARLWPEDNEEEVEGRIGEGESSEEEEEDVDLQVRMNGQLMVASGDGDTSQVRTLLSDGAVPSYQNHIALLAAAENDHIDTVRELLRHDTYSPRVYTSGRRGMSWQTRDRLFEMINDIEDAGGANAAEIAQLIEDHIHEGETDEDEIRATRDTRRLIQAAANNDRFDMRALIDSHADLTYRDHRALHMAGRNGHIGVVREMFAPRMDSRGNDDSQYSREEIHSQHYEGRLLEIAEEIGDYSDNSTEIARLIRERVGDSAERSDDEYTNGGQRFDAPGFSAVSQNNPFLTRLEDADDHDPVYRPASQNNHFLIRLAAAGDHDGVSSLIGDDVYDIDPTYNNHQALREASVGGHTRVVNDLLSHHAYNVDEIRQGGYLNVLSQILRSIPRRHRETIAALDAKIQEVEGDE